MSRFNDDYQTEDFLEPGEMPDAEEREDAIEPIEDEEEEEVVEEKPAVVAPVAVAEPEPVKIAIDPKRPLKEQALAKLAPEMLKEHSSLEDFIHNFICDSSDDTLFRNIFKDGKTIKACSSYVTNKAKEAAGKSSSFFGFGNTVYDTPLPGWITGYFASDEKAVVPKAKAVVSTGTKAVPSPTPTIPVKPAVPEKPKPIQTSLFDF